MSSIKRRKSVDKRTYQSKTPTKRTSYDTSQTDADTPQEIRETVEPEGQMKRAIEGKEGLDKD
ncbi:hypothetical protein HMI54_014159 [Coelomomyces lativittatus]|nr:hypothetical protein HMI54_014159 [Coelomomyces lativittatus]